jgi:hypothetical protein
MKKALLLFLFLFASYITFSQSYGLGRGLIYLNLGTTAAQVSTEAQFDVSQEILNYFPSVSTSINLP